MRVPLSRYWALLARYLRQNRRTFTLMSALLLSGIGLKVLIPQVTRYFIDAARDGAAANLLLTAALGFVGLALVQQILAVGAAYFGEAVAWSATNALRADLAAHCLRMDLGFHNERTPGELIERIDGDVTQLAQFFSQLVIRVIGNVLLLFGILVALYMEHTWVGAGYTVFAIVTLWGLNSVRTIAIPYEKGRREAAADLYGFLEERLGGAEDIRSSGAVAYVLRGLYKLQRVIHHFWRKVSVRYWAIGVMARSLTMVGYVMAFGFGYFLYKDGVITLGTAYLLVHYNTLLARPFQELTQEVESLQGVGAAIERIEELGATETALIDGDGEDLPDGPLGLEFEDVSFAYKSAEPVLQDVSFRLAPGEILGVLGRTGSGKTTLTRLLFRFYDPDRGHLRLSGAELRDQRLSLLRRRVAMVTQDVQLFQASVRDNLTFFDASIEDARILEMLDQLGLRDWLEGLPDGLDTRIETGGRSLSAGEAQLLALSRVFLRDPGLVILDEASSRLDPATEHRIERAMDVLLRGRTAIIVAHRLRTVQRADRILILDEGRVAEEGEREALAADEDSRFAQLLRTGLETEAA
ncbi:MAG: ABC transporter ATP-binding protein [Myxococcales bacterium]|nr:ABC transporter ATP-binding protein [Myxococcales bacterium]